MRVSLMKRYSLCMSEEWGPSIIRWPCLRCFLLLRSLFPSSSNIVETNPLASVRCTGWHIWSVKKLPLTKNVGWSAIFFFSPFGWVTQYIQASDGAVTVVWPRRRDAIFDNANGGRKEDSAPSHNGSTFRVFSCPQCNILHTLNSRITAPSIFISFILSSS